MIQSPLSMGEIDMIVSFLRESPLSSPSLTLVWRKAIQSRGVHTCALASDENGANLQWRVCAQRAFHL